MPPGAPSAPAGRAAQPDTTGATGAPEATGTDGAAGRTGRPRLLGTAAVAVRRHWLVSILLAAGVVLRVLALVAYHPALIYVDTLKYLYGASPGSEPLGYTVLLRLMLLAGDLGMVAVIQHLLGLAMAVTLYAVLLRRGAGRWLAALAVAPVLLDAYQIQMEQTIMPDVWFEAMIVAALAVLLWRPAVSVPFAVAAGNFGRGRVRDRHFDAPARFEIHEREQHAGIAADLDRLACDDHELRAAVGAAQLGLGLRDRFAVHQQLDHAFATLRVVEHVELVDRLADHGIAGVAGHLEEPAIDLDVAQIPEVADDRGRGIGSECFFETLLGARPVGQVGEEQHVQVR